MMSSTDLEGLIAAWLDGRLGADESKALQEELRASREARSVFLRYSRVDVALHELADTSGMQGLSKLIADAADTSVGRGISKSNMDRRIAEQSPAGVALPASVTRGSTPLNYVQVMAWCAGIAVALLLTVSLVDRFDTRDQQSRVEGELGVVAGTEPSPSASATPPQSLPPLQMPPGPVATLAASFGAVWENSQLEVGQALYERDSLVLQRGKARISVGYGAEVVATAPCSLTLLASDRIQLHAGNLAVDVASWAKGFTVVTDEMDIVDLGTTFTVTASPGVKSETTVLKGLVRVHPAKARSAQPRGVLVTEGRHLSIDYQGILRNVKQQDLEALGSLDFGVAGPYRPVDLNNTGLGLAVGDEDQHWRVVRGPESSFSGPQFATVCPPERGYIPNDPESSQWISIAEWQTAEPNSIYTFQTEFELSGYDLSTMQLFGRFLADNGIAAVRVNGKPVQVQSWVDNVKYQPFGDSQFRFVNITEGLVVGRNVIELDVNNGMMRTGKIKDPPMLAIPNPMALRVEWYAFGRREDRAEADASVRTLSVSDNSRSPRAAFFGSGF